MVRKLLLITLSICCTVINVSGQYQNVWVFGTNAGVDFNSGSPVAIQTNFRQHEGCASICDANGKLQFYTQGEIIFDRNYNPMPNGNMGINYGNVGSQTQPVVITPMPGNPNKYYIFINERYLWYCIVDMSLNNGLGDVSTRPVSLNYKEGIGGTEKLAVGNGADCNFWILTRTRDNEYDSMTHQYQQYYAFEVTENGVDTVPVVSSVANLGNYGSGVITFSPDGTKMVETGFDTRLYDFNPYTGRLSNPVLVDTLGGYGACFSADDSKLYISRNRRSADTYDAVYQYDLSQSDIISTRTMIGTDSGRGAAGYLKIGPDGKIYQANSFDRSLNIIPDPNQAGLACGFIRSMVPLVPGTSTSIGLPNEPGIFKPNDTVTGNTTLIVCFSDSIKISAKRVWDSTAIAYRWNTGAITESIFVTDPGWYIVGYRINPCGSYYIDSFYVQWEGRLPNLYTSSGKSCPGINQDTAIIIPITGDTFLYTYQWYKANDSLLKTTIGNTSDTIINLAPGNYKINISSTYGCDTTIPFTIEPPLHYNASFTIDSILCQHQTYTFQNTSTGNLNTWYWNFGDGHTSIQQDPQHSYSFPGSYRVKLITSNNIPCYDTFYRDITVDSFGIVSFSASRTEICTGENIFFYPAYSGNLTALYWNLGNNNYSESIDNELQHSFDREGTYPVTLTGKFRACPDTAFTDTIKVFPLPIVTLGNDTFICLKGIPVVLKNTVNHSGAHHYLWNTGATTESIEARYPGVYTLTVTNEKECSNTSTIELKKDCYLDIPNAFTPNSDGVNDYFLPRQLLSKSVSYFHMQVFNRWGEKVFGTASIDGRGWDGKMNGKAQPEGVYIYVIEAVFDSGKREKHEGDITLIR